MIDWHAVLGVLAGCIEVYSIVPYIRDMLHGETGPNIVSWTLWTLIQMIIVAAQFTAGASLSIAVPVIMTVNTLLVLSLCLFGYGYKNIVLSMVGVSCSRSLPSYSGG